MAAPFRSRIKHKLYSGYFEDSVVLRVSNLAGCIYVWALDPRDLNTPAWKQYYAYQVFVRNFRCSTSMEQDLRVLDVAASTGNLQKRASCHGSVQ